MDEYEAMQAQLESVRSEQIAKLSEEEMRELLILVSDIAVDGAGEDGGHHKQWYLICIAKAIIGDRWHEYLGILAENDYLLDQGVAP